MGRRSNRESQLPNGLYRYRRALQMDAAIKIGISLPFTNWLMNSGRTCERAETGGICYDAVPHREHSHHANDGLDPHMSLQWIPGRIVKKHVWSEGLFTLTLDCPGVQPLECGQFLQLGLALPEKHLHRPYSAASPHGRELEFFIVRVDGGELTPRMASMELGETLDVSMKATGSFTLQHSPPAQCLWLLATGTGLAPYVAMLRDPKIWSMYAYIVVVHGVRHLTDFAYTEELQSHAERHPGRLSVIPIASRALAPHGVQGRITTAIESGALEQLAGHTLSPENSAVMMCGNPQMLDDVEALLHGRGMHKHKRNAPGHYVVERYW